MGDKTLVGVLMVSPVLLCAAALRWVSAEWLTAFEQLARCAGKSL